MSMFCRRLFRSAASPSRDWSPGVPRDLHPDQASDLVDQWLCWYLQWISRRLLIYLLALLRQWTRHWWRVRLKFIYFHFLAFTAVGYPCADLYLIYNEHGLVHKNTLLYFTSKIRISKKQRLRYLQLAKKNKIYASSVAKDGPGEC